jgi:hypothetical protein
MGEDHGLRRKGSARKQLGVALASSAFLAPSTFRLKILFLARCSRSRIPWQVSTDSKRFVSPRFSRYLFALRLFRFLTSCLLLILQCSTACFALSSFA